VIVNFLQAVLAFILVLAPLVFIHELGHFLAAKAFRIGVPVFSIGFGPRIFGFKRAETDYRISLIPLGGYVRMSGDEADEERTGAPEEFLSRPKYQRFIVFVAGAAFNIVLAFLMLWLYFGVWGKTILDYPTVAAIQEQSSASEAGLLVGDKLVEMSGQDLGDGKAQSVIMLEEWLAPDKEVDVVVERDGQRIEATVFNHKDDKLGIGRAGWFLRFGDGSPIIDTVVEGRPADHAGILSGDKVVAAEGIPEIGEVAFRMLIEAAPGKEIGLTVEREGALLEIRIVPEDESGTGKIGVSFTPQDLPRRTLSVGEAAAESLRSNIELSKTLFVVLGRLVKRDVPLKTMSGPIGIAQVAKNALFNGWEEFVYLLAFFSLQLGILNLLPIPVLDGGHILILLIEGVIRRDLPEAIKERVMQVGFVFLLTFMGLVIVMDLMKTLG
jgi:regulator of sigma E protease